MALSSKIIPFFFVLALLSVQINARDVQFFSKVSPSTTTTVVIPTTATTANNSKEQDNLNKQEQEPTFLPETENGYGLYGHESTETKLPTTNRLGAATYSTGTSYTPYKTPIQTQNQNQETYTNYPNTNNNNYDTNNQFYNNAYNQEQQQNYYHEKQGMSDTRFFENGKYYYDVKNENNFSPNQYQNSRTSNYDTRAYYNNNNENSFEFDNSMENFENQDEQYVP